jgi:hypothetical protein
MDKSCVDHGHDVHGAHPGEAGRPRVSWAASHAPALGLRKIATSPDARGLAGSDVLSHAASDEVALVGLHAGTDDDFPNVAADDPGPDPDDRGPDLSPKLSPN